jgi:hypothetical protein
MTPLAEKILRALVPIIAFVARLRQGAEWLFLSKRDHARNTALRLDELKRKEMEIERIDRLRNPSNYKGR